MDQEPRDELPAYLAELLDETPLGRRKCLAAWDGLSIESQIRLLSEIQQRQRFFLSLPLKAVKNENAYVRYLGARQLSGFMDKVEGGQSIRASIENDVDPLVASVLFECPGFAFLDKTVKDPEKFFGLPHEARLAKMRTLSQGGEILSRLLAFGAEACARGELREEELGEIAKEYFGNPYFKQEYFRPGLGYDGFAEFSRGRDISALWELVLKTPESIGDVLLCNLPEGAGLSGSITKETLDQLTPRQFEILLSRPDIHLEKVRKDIFFRKPRELRRIIDAAVAHNLHLNYEEFHQVIDQSNADRVQDLYTLASSHSLDPAILEAIHDAVMADSSLDAFHAELADRSKLRKLSSLRNGAGTITLPMARLVEIGHLRLYRLAKSVVPWKGTQASMSLPQGLNFLTAEIVPGNTWATFIRFSAACSGRWSDFEELDRNLPKISEANEPEELKSQLVNAVSKQLESRMSDVQRLLNGLEERLNANEAEMQNALKLASSEVSTKFLDVSELVLKIEKSRQDSNQAFGLSARRTQRLICMVLVVLLLILWKVF